MSLLKITVITNFLFFYRNIYKNNLQNIMYVLKIKQHKYFLLLLAVDRLLQPPLSFNFFFLQAIGIKTSPKWRVVVHQRRMGPSYSFSDYLNSNNFDQYSAFSIRKKKYKLQSAVYQDMRLQCMYNADNVFATHRVYDMQQRYSNHTGEFCALAGAEHNEFSTYSCIRVMTSFTWHGLARLVVHLLAK